MSSSRAEAVAEILWELKRADKLATYTEIAQRAGFSPGANGRTMNTCLKHVRRDWPHLQWYRALSDDLLVEKEGEQYEELTEAGYEFVESEDKDDSMKLANPDEALLNWSAVEAS